MSPINISPSSTRLSARKSFASLSGTPRSDCEQHEREMRQGTTPQPEESPQRQRSSDNIKVAVRVRSFLPRERDANNNQLCIRMKNHTCELTGDNLTKTPFTFDYCFWSNDTSDGEMAYSNQEDVFTDLGPPIIEHILNGMNASVICYGQTGSGKTFTMFGPPNPTPESFGLIPRICGGLFSRLSSETQHFTATVSIVEIYLERTFDLLNQRKELRIRGDLRNGFKVVNANQVEISGYDSLIPLLKYADLQKTYSSTALNERSSRAHTLFELNVRTFSTKGTRISKLMLVDLAGSERVKASGAEGKSFEQACNINLSLMHLGKCIEGVASHTNANNDLVEFRHSALTKLLKESLGGNAKTTIVVTISPSQVDANNTLHALRFADRAKKIRNHAVINEYSLEHQICESDELNRLFEARMENLKAEHELEQKQQELLGRQIELEQQMGLLEEERSKLSAEREDHLRLTVKEREQLARREKEIQVIASKIDSEFKVLHAQRKDLENKMDEVSIQNNQFVEEKKIADKEIMDLQLEIGEMKNMHRKEVDEKDTLQVISHEQEARADIESTCLRETIHILDQQRKEHGRTCALVAKTETIAERRRHQLESSGLKKQIQDAHAQLKSLQISNDERSSAWNRRITGLQEELSLIQNQHKNDLAERTLAEKEYCSKISALENEGQLMEKRLAKMEGEIFQGRSEAQSTQLVQDEMIERQKAFNSEQKERFLLQICTKCLIGFFRDENMTRGEVVVAEQAKYHEIREEYFSRQKKIFYKKALSLTQCIQDGRY